jgi:mRNA interferase MazF
MERFVKGDVVVVPFPFSDLSASKRRPALVLFDLPGDDILLCQITSQENNDRFSISLDNIDFISGGLPSSSFIRPTRIFTADKKIIIRKSGNVKNTIFKKVVKVLIDLLN